MSKKIGLILTIGLATEPSIKRINHLKPDFVYFIHSKKSKENALFIIEETNITNYAFKVLDDHESVDDSFVKSLECIAELQEDDYEVIGDFTVGTKPMVAGLVMACIEKNCDYKYLGESSEDSRKDGMGPVKSGEEKNKDQENPYENYAINEFRRGKVLFNKYQFLAARDNFTQANEKLIYSDLKERANLFIKIVNLYENWDKFSDEVKILNEDKLETYPLNVYLNQILEDIKNSPNLLNYFKNEIPDFYKQLKKNKQFLDRRISEDNKITKSNRMYYLPDLLNNAERRIIEGKYDDAVARLYRVVELIAQLRLAQYNLIDDNKLSQNRSFSINKDQLSNKLNKNQLSEIDYWSPKNWNNSNKKLIDLGLNEDYRLLNICGEGSTSEFDNKTISLVKNYKRIQEELQKRNKSILAHGLMPINENQANRLFKLVLKHARFLSKQIDNNRDFAKFPNFLDNDK